MGARKNTPAAAVARVPPRKGAPLGARAAPAAGAMSHPAASLSCGRAVRVRRDRRCVRVVGVCVCASCARSVDNTGGQAACVRREREYASHTL